MQQEQDTRRSVRALQDMLALLARQDPRLPRLAVTGVFDEATLEAVMVFQRDAGLPVTGVVDQDTWYAVAGAHRRAQFRSGPPAPLRVLPHGGHVTPAGQSSEPVRIAQAMLCGLSQSVSGISPCQADGVNRGTVPRDLARLQALAGLEATGDLDRATWEILTRLYHAFVLRGAGQALSPA